MTFDDAARLATLADYRVLDSEAEESFDNITVEGRTPTAVNADPDLVLRLFENLVSNAIRHAPEAARVEIGIRPAASLSKPTAAALVSAPTIQVREIASSSICRQLDRVTAVQSTGASCA